MLYKKLKIKIYNILLIIIYIIILTNSCNCLKLKALSIVHSTCLKVSLKMALQIGPKHVVEIIS
jgi:hypothetical protein